MLERECVRRAISTNSNYVWFGKLSILSFTYPRNFFELFCQVYTNENDQLNVFAAINPTSAGTKQRVSRYLKKVFMSEEFEAVIETMMDIVGSHSIQKFASMHARRSGCSRGDLNVRGR